MFYFMNQLKICFEQVLAVPEKLLPCDGESELGGVDDMTKLTYLNEPSVLDNLQRRYGLNEIYVSVLNLQVLNG